jgi:hypothetical protein
VYRVHLYQQDIDYLAGRSLSDRARAAVENFITEVIGGVGDAFRNDPANRAGASYFFIQLVLVDYWGDRRGHTFDFFVNDARAAAGDLVVGYVEMDRRPAPP